MYGARDSLDDSSVEKSQRKAVYDFMGELYDLSDVDGDGVLSERELMFGQFLTGEDSSASQGGVYQKDTSGFDFGTRRAKDMHKTLDVNRDGMVDMSEFWLLWEGSYPFLPNGTTHTGEGFAEVVKRLAGEADVDGDGGLAWQEFYFASFLVNDRLAHELAVTILGGLDRDGDGRVERREITDAITEMQQAGEPGVAAMHQVLKGFNLADANGDGFLDQWEATQVAASILEVGKS